MKSHRKPSKKQRYRKLSEIRWTKARERTKMVRIFLYSSTLVTLPFGCLDVDTTIGDTRTEHSSDYVASSTVLGGLGVDEDMGTQ